MGARRKSHERERFGGLANPRPRGDRHDRDHRGGDQLRLGNAVRRGRRGPTRHQSAGVRSAGIRGSDDAAQPGKQPASRRRRGSPARHALPFPWAFLESSAERRRRDGRRAGSRTRRRTTRIRELGRPLAGAGAAETPSETPRDVPKRTRGRPSLPRVGVLLRWATETSCRQAAMLRREAPSGAWAPEARPWTRRRQSA